MILQHQIIELKGVEKGLLWLVVAAHHGSKRHP